MFDTLLIAYTSQAEEIFPNKGVKVRNTRIMY